MFHGPHVADLAGPEGAFSGAGGGAGLPRRFYSTASIFHGAGLEVEPDGSVVPEAQAREPVFTFEPIRVSCDDSGVTRWEYADADTGRYILKVSGPRYASAMAEAMGRALEVL